MATKKETVKKIKQKMENLIENFQKNDAYLIKEYNQKYKMHIDTASVVYDIDKKMEDIENQRKRNEAHKSILAFFFWISFVALGAYTLIMDPVGSVLYLAILAILAIIPFMLVVYTLVLDRSCKSLIVRMNECFILRRRLLIGVNLGLHNQFVRLLELKREHNLEGDGDVQIECNHASAMFHLARDLIDEIKNENREILFDVTNSWHS
jgi:hypothetical protein